MSLGGPGHRAPMAQLDQREKWVCKVHLEVKGSPDPRGPRDRPEIREHPETGETLVKMEPLVVKVTSERRETPEHLENKGYLDLPDRKGRGDLPGPQDSKGQSD